MTDNSNSTDETTTTADETAPAPKLAGDMPRARPDLIDTDAAKRLLRTADSYWVATSGPFAGIWRDFPDAPAVLFHVVEDEQGDRHVEVCHSDAGISTERAAELATYFGRFYDLDHDALQPGTLVGIYEDLRDPDHCGNPGLVESFGVLGPDAARADFDEFNHDRDELAAYLRDLRRDLAGRYEGMRSAGRAADESDRRDHPRPNGDVEVVEHSAFKDGERRWAVTLRWSAADESGDSGRERELERSGDSFATDRTASADD